MANLHLVTGYAGEAHITAEDQGAFNSAIIGKGQFVLNKGNLLSASIISNNQIRIADGDISMQGRHIRLNENSYVDLTIENGTQGYYRNDLIVARYTKNTSTGVEECNLVVIKGESVTSNPVDPEYTSGDIIEEHATVNDMPLYRVPLDGLNVGELVCLFDTLDTSLTALVEAVATATAKANNAVNAAAGAYSMAYNDACEYADSKIVCGTEDVADGDESTYPNGTLYVVIE